MKSIFNKKNSVAVAVASSAVVTTLAVAGATTTATDDFGQLAQVIQDWLEGGLGQLLALASLAIGLGIGLVQQSIMAIALGVGMALACYYGPGILVSLFGAGFAV